MLLITCDIQVCPLEVDIDQKVLNELLLGNYFCSSVFSKMVIQVMSQCFLLSFMVVKLYNYSLEINVWIKYFIAIF